MRDTIPEPPMEPSEPRVRRPEPDDLTELDIERMEERARERAEQWEMRRLWELQQRRKVEAA